MSCGAAGSRWADLLPVPDLPDPCEHRVEAPAAAAKLDAADLVVVLPGSEPEPEAEPAAGEGLDAEGLLGKRNGVAAERAEQDRGREPDPLGDRRRGGERDERLVVPVTDAVDRAEAGEAPRLCPPRPLDELRSGGALHRVWKSDADIHRHLLVRCQVETR